MAFWKFFFKPGNAAADGEIRPPKMMLGGDVGTA
jgi:hypothetical protein